MKKIISFIAITALLFACSKTEIPSTEDSEVVATEEAKGGNGNGNGGGGGGSALVVTTDEASYILPFGVISGGSISSSGGGNKVTERGVCFSINSEPTIDDDTVVSGSGSGTFTSILSWLDDNTTYYVRAYASKTKNGTTTTTYGDELSFTTTEAIYGTVDYNDFTYHTIEIGSQVWMMENLRTTTYRDGVTPIPNVTDNSAWEATAEAAYCDFNNDPSISDDYGRLYNSYAASNSLIAPDGWHVPSLAEFNTLTDYLGGEVAGGRMKKDDITRWSSPNTGADNSSGFTALGAGMRSYNGIFSNLGEKNNFWTSFNGYQMFLLNHNSGSWGYAWGTCSNDHCHRYGSSIRLIKD